MGSSLSQDVLGGVIEAQNEISSAALDSGEVMTLVAVRARALTGADTAVVELEHGEEIVYHAGSGAGTGLMGRRLDVGERLSGLRTRRDEILECSDARRDPRVDADAARRAGVLSIISVPLRHRGREVGALKVYSRLAAAFGPDDVSVLQLLSALLAAHLAHAHELERRLVESTKDALTGLANRRAFEERLGAEVARVRRHGGSLALCLVDIDDFQDVNQTLGRVVGDEVLRGVARNLAHVRGEDEAFRLEADEFAVIFAGVDASGARTAARRLASAVQADRGCGGVTVSWGVADIEGGDPAALLARAENALNRAKRAGSL